MTTVERLITCEWCALGASITIEVPASKPGEVPWKRHACHRHEDKLRRLVVVDHGMTARQLGAKITYHTKPA